MTRLTVAVAALTLAATPLAAQDTSPAAPQNVSVELVIARAVADRMPVDTASTFQADVGRVACWARITGAAGSTIHLVWMHGGQEFQVPMQIGGSPWRVWSTKEMQPDWTGEWRVEARSETGTVLATRSFTIAPAVVASPVIAEPQQPAPAPPPRR